MLDELPAMGEPACPGPSGPVPNGFTTHNRFIRGKDQAHVGSPGCVGVRYHGLDYMLLHNLYAIATPATWNGAPNADPCAVAPDDFAAADGAVTPDAATADTKHAGGCCGADRSATNIPVAAIAIAWILRRKRRGRSPL
jgi:hypothetical protein